MELLGDFAGSAVVRLSAFPAVAGVQSLVRELKSCKSCNLAKKKKKKKGLFYFETYLYILSEKLFPEEPRTITVFLFFLGCCKYRHTINKCMMPDKGMHIPSQDVVLNIHSF